MGFIPEDSGSAKNYAYTIFTSAFLGFSVKPAFCPYLPFTEGAFLTQAMYPTIMIALVNNNRTIDYMYSMNASLPTISHDRGNEHRATLQLAEPSPTANDEAVGQPGEKRGSALAA